MTDERSFQSLAFTAEADEADEIDSFTLPYLVVGIGASAGGVEAYIDLLEHLPNDTGMAFVLIPHLAPDHKSHMVEILQKHTAMPVHTIENGVSPQPNCVYVVPPNQYVAASRGHLLLEPKNGTNRLAIDHFFRSLAADQKNKAIGVILSGMDSDGALGLTAIKGEGGISIVQEPDSARHPSMPRSSIAADHVDKVVPPAGIALELTRLARLFKAPELLPLENGEIRPDHTETLRKIFKMLRGLHGLDFSLYKSGTVHRRVARRLLVNKIDALPEYLKLLQSSPDELQLLHEDLLVGLTRFFRDPEMYQALKTHVFPSLFESRSASQPIRLWVAGCSTGEEVYSVVICLLEYMLTNKLDQAIQVFGTDASERSIQKARTAIYPESLANEISSERLRRYFARVEHGYQVAKRVRDVCIFARQNLCTDPPFSRLDLITCRNVLIYLGPVLQRQVIPTFHYALKPAGFLILGMSESIREFPDLFDTMDRKNKIFLKIGTGRGALDLPRLMPSTSTKAVIAMPEIAEQNVRWSELELQRIADRIIIAQYGPPGFVIDEKLDILQSRGDVSPFVAWSEGAPSFNLVRMLHPQIAVTVRDAVQKSIQEDIPARVENLCLVNNGDAQEFDVEVLPVHTPPTKTTRFLVLFTTKSSFRSRPFRPELEEPLPNVTGDAAALIAQLRTDLSSSKVYLQSLIEERDIRNQELTSSNEEVQAANEELQSTNEELETTKEELQSANEELQTVNEELSHRNANLTESSNDLANLLTSVNIPVLMLNNELQIRQFTPLTQKLLSVRPSDIGRPISEIRLNFFVENLEEVLCEVLETLTARELEVQDREGRWHLLKIRPYRTSDNKIEGVVLIMFDIDQLRRSQLDLRAARDFATDVIEAVQVPVVLLEQTLAVRSANHAFRTLSGLTPNELGARSFPDLAARVWGLTTIGADLEKISGPESKTAHFESELESEKGERRTFYIRASALSYDGGHVLLLTLEDITQRKRAEQIMASENQLLAGQVRSTSQALGQTREELRALTSRLFTSQEEERQRVARDLHDDVGQQLALVQMDIEQVQSRLAQKPDSLQPQLQSLSRRVAGLSDDVRKLSHRLHPSILNDLGLGYALKSLVDEFGEREGMPASITRINVPDQLPKTVAATLYRIAQEALRNVVKHAGKTHVRVILEGEGDRIRLQVVDMGEGFDQDQRVEGLGLLSMAERARLASGTFQINSQLGRGTTITVEIPLVS